VIRLRALANFRISIDPTWDYTDVSIWTGAELAAGIVCASLPAIRQLLTMILPKRFHSFLTNRSRSRSIQQAGREVTPSVRRYRKDNSVFEMSCSENDDGSVADYLSMNRRNSQRQGLRDVECGRVYDNSSQMPSCSSSQTKSGDNSRSLRTSFWSSIDWASSSPSSLQPQTHYLSENDGVSTRTESTEPTGKTSVDEQVELLRAPETSYMAAWQPNSAVDNITALPRVGAWTDREHARYHLPRNWRKD
jgi:hypothetical protein